MEANAQSKPDLPLEHDGHITARTCWCAPMRDDKTENLWIHYDAIHPSHNMQLSEGALNRGVWSGTWRCKHCRAADFRGRDGGRTSMASLNEPCPKSLSREPPASIPDERRQTCRHCGGFIPCGC